MDTSFLLRIGNKIPMKGVTETKFGAETKEWTIQRLYHPGIHPIISHQTQTLLLMPARFCWKDPDIGVSLWGYASAWETQKWMFTVSYRMEHRAPNGGPRESTQGAEEFCNPIGGTTIWTNHTREPLTLAAYVSKDGLVSHHWKERPIGHANFICPSTGEHQGQKLGVGG